MMKEKQNLNGKIFWGGAFYIIKNNQAENEMRVSQLDGIGMWWAYNLFWVDIILCTC